MEVFQYTSEEEVNYHQKNLIEVKSTLSNQRMNQLKVELRQ